MPNYRRNVPKQVLDFQRQLIHAQKSVFDNTFNALTALQEQQQGLVQRALAQLPRLPDEARELMDTWQDAAVSSRQQFKSAVDESYRALEAFLDRVAADESTPAAKTAPTSATAGGDKPAKPKKKAVKKKAAKKKASARKTAKRSKRSSK